MGYNYIETSWQTMKNTGKNFKQERTHIYGNETNDVYRSTKKLQEPTICKSCGALLVNGRWTWDDIPPEVFERLCAACQRIEDQYPAGIIEVNGPFFRDHQSEIINMIKNIHFNEISEHPLERIMNIEEKNGKTIITTTGMHIARRIGDALYNAYEGELNYNYDDENLIRVQWKR